MDLTLMWILAVFASVEVLAVASLMAMKHIGADEGDAFNLVVALVALIPMAAFLVGVLYYTVTGVLPWVERVFFAVAHGRLRGPCAVPSLGGAAGGNAG